MGSKDREAIHSSSTNEWHTPWRYIKLVRNTLGGIHLDPASNATANRTVQAKTYLTKEQDGLSRAWADKWFCNPPYGRNTGEWVEWAASQFLAGFNGILLVNAVPDRKWFKRLWRHPICFTDHRIRFLRPDGEPGGMPTHGSAFVGMLDNPIMIRKFYGEFSRVGTIVVAEKETP